MSGVLCDPLGSLLRRGLGLDHAHHVGLLHDQEILAVEPDLGARPFAEQDAVADLDVERLQLAAVIARAGSGGEDLAFLRLFLGGVGMMMPPAVFSSASMRRTRIRSCNGRNVMSFSL